MNATQLSQKINKELHIQTKGALFGKTQEPLLEVGASDFFKVGRWLKENSEMKMDSVDCYTAYETNETLVFVLFLRSQILGHTLVLKSTLKGPLSARVACSFDSIQEIWGCVDCFEKEIAQGFGVQFENQVRTSTPPSPPFPLRKEFFWEID